MLRVGLTGGLGSGKSTAARMFAEHGAVVLESDAIGRTLMQPGESVHAAIVNLLGPDVVQPGGTLDRAALARLAFAEGHGEELNAIVHPAVIARQGEIMRSLPRDSIVLIESALIFETRHGGQQDWRTRFHRIALVTAPEALKIERFVTRSKAGESTRPVLEADARRRLAMQIPDIAKVAECNYIIANDRDLDWLRTQVEQVWQQLLHTASAST